MQYKEMTIKNPRLRKRIRSLTGGSFSRASVGYTPYGVTVATGVDRHEMLVPTGTVSNLLTGNQSDGGDTSNPELLTLNQRTGTSTLGDTTGFTGIGTTPATLSSNDNLSYVHTGTKSVAVDCAGANAGEGVRINTTTVANATSYISGAWVWAPTGATLTLLCFNDGGGTQLNTDVNFTGNNAWQWVETVATTVDTTLKTNIKTVGTAQDITFYVDDCRLATNTTTGFTGNKGDEVLSVTGEKSYQGYRSLKVVTDGSHTAEGVKIAYTATVGVTYTFSAYIYAPNGQAMSVLMYSGGVIGSTSFTGSGMFQLVTFTGTAGNSSTTIYVQTDGTKAAVTFYVDQVMIESGSTAHGWAYGGSSYPLGYTMEGGLLVEEATTNLLTANQSTGTDTLGDTTGFTSNASATLGSSTEQSHCGTKSLKVVTPGTVPVEGTYLSLSGLTDSASYTLSGWVYLPLGSVLGWKSLYVTGTGGWQYITTTWTQSGTTYNFYIVTRGAAQAITFYVDQLQLEAKAYPTSWTLGGTERKAETMTIPPSVVNLTEGTIEAEVLVNQSFISATGRVFGIGTSATANRITAYYSATNKITGLTRDNSSNATTTASSNAFTLNTWVKIALSYKSTGESVALSGTITNSSGTVYLPTSLGTYLYLLAKFDGSGQGDTLIRNVVISKTKRADTDITARSVSGYAVDKNVTAILPLKTNLNAYKVGVN